MFRECFALHVKENVQLLQMINGLIRVVIGGWLLGNQHHIFYLPGHIVQEHSQVCFHLACSFREDVNV
jgi:hypothetical protein